MKKLFLIAAVALVAVSTISCNNKATAKSSPLADSVSMAFGDLFGNGMAPSLKAQDSTINMDEVLKGVEYIMRADTSNHAFMNGLQVGMQIMQMYQGIRQQYGINIDKELFLQHFAAALKSGKNLDQAQLMELQQKIDPLVQRAAAEAREKDPAIQKLKADGKAYLQKVEKEGYTKTASGLLYKVEKEGTGDNFTDADAVLVNYTGKHIDGSVFDSNEERAEPVAFRLNQVVPGFAEMIKLMKPGSKVTLVLPAELAYGEEGSRNPMTGEQIIKPYETLIFELETVGVQPAGQPAPARPAPQPAK